MLKWVTTVDHKQIAVLYMLTRLFFFSWEVRASNGGLGGHGGA